MIDELEGLAAARPGVAVELTERAFTRLDQADLDDSDGWLTQFCQRLTALHAESAGAACLPADEVAARRARLQTLDLRPFDGVVDLD